MFKLSMAQKREIARAIIIWRVFPAQGFLASIPKKYTTDPKWVRKHLIHPGNRIRNKSAARIEKLRWRTLIQQDIDADNISIMNKYLVVAVNKCTCYGGGPYGHEPGCGYEPIAPLIDLIAGDKA